MLLSNTKVDMVVFLIYMYDIVVIGNNTPLIQSVVSKLNEIFALNDLGSLNNFLGIEVVRTYKVFHLCQKKHIL